MRQKKILFLGGAFAQIPIIHEARKRGMHIVTCDYMPENPGHRLADEYFNVSTTDFEGVLKLATKVEPDFILAYASDPAAPTAAYVSEILGLPGNSYQSVRNLCEKDVFRNLLKGNGFNTPEFFLINENNNVHEKKSGLSFPYIIKPTDSSGSKGITKVYEQAGVEAAIKYALRFSRNQRIIAEELIETNEKQLHGDGFVLDGKLVFSYLGDHHYDKKVNPFVPFSTTWPSTRNKEEIHRIEECVDNAIHLSGYKNGPVNIEARITDNGEIYIMEIGPRSGGNFVPQIINYATGFDMVGATLDILMGKKVLWQPARRENAAYYVIYSETDGTLDRLVISNKLKPYIKEYHQYIKSGGKVSSFQGANAAIGILLMTFNDHETMEYIISNMREFVDLKIVQH